MKAIGKYIVINPIKETSTRYRRASIVSVGTDVNKLKAGNEIYYDKSAGFNIEIKNNNYKVIKEFDVVVVL